MKYFLSILFFLLAFVVSGQNICVSVDCKDTIRYPQPVTLNGLTQSTDGVKSRLWRIVSGSGTINNVNVDTTFATGMTTDGLYVFSLTGTSNKNAVGVAYDSVIYFANRPPQAVTGPTVNTTDNTATLSGSGSFDAEGLPLTFFWTELSGPGTATISTNTMANPIVSGLITGTYVFRLTVTDQGGLTNTATQNVVVTLPKLITKTVTTQTAIYASDGVTITSTTTVKTTYYSDGSSTTVTSTVP